MKKLVLHIGMPKSASSTIQKFLADYSGELEQQNIFVPSFLGALNHRFLFSIIKYEFGEDDPALRLRGLREHHQKKRFVDRLKSQLAENFSALDDESLTVISCEQLASLNFQQIKSLRVLLVEYFEKIDIVCYFRRQDLFLVSGYSTQIISGRYHLFSDEFKFPDPAPAFLWYENVLNKWSDVFYDSVIKIRTIDDAYLVGGSVLSDLQDAIGIDLPVVESAVITENQSMPAAMIEFVRRLNARLGCENLDAYDKAAVSGITQPISKLTGLSGTRFKPARSEAVDFYAQFASSNSNIAQTYLDRDQLFTENFSFYPEDRVALEDSEILDAGLEFIKTYILNNIKGQSV